MAVLGIALAYLGFIGSAHSVPSPTSVGSELTLLYNNDLDRPNAPQHKSALLLSTRSDANAKAACAQLGETLLPINTTFFTTDLPPTLEYQVFQGAVPPTQEFWVASKGITCQVVDAQGRVSASSCLRELPALCSQSAGFQAAPETATSLTVHSQDLIITGFRDQLSFKFLGIPYADQPARWTYSTPYTGPTTINATQFGPSCVQTGTSGTSEECLFLNIWTPFIPENAATTPKSKLKAVIFWIHGGAFTSGSGADPTFDGGNFASRGDVVLITINYRLSTLGFLALDDGVTNGNFGLADQIQALEWVQQHVSAFGGDAERITIYGQSAGAASVRALMASPKAIGKFAAAIPSSNLAGDNYATTYSLYYTIPQEVSVAVEPILRETGCDNATDTLACLKAVDGNTLVNLPDVARYLVVDGTFLTSNGLPLNGSGPIANVHTLMGFMRDDGAAFIGYPTSDNVTAGLLGAFLPLTVENNSLFPVPTGPNATLDVFNLTARVTTDIEFRCLDQATAISAVKHNLLKSVWFYEFNRSYQTSPGFDPNFPVCDAPVDAEHPFGDPSKEYFKCHSGDLYYTFGNLPTATLPYRDADDLPFMQLTLDTWASFARTFNPNPDPAFLKARGLSGTAALIAKQSLWEPVTGANVNAKPLRVLQLPSFMDVFSEGAQCEFMSLPLDFFG
ncbi:carboxylesterase from carbohydrate esterase [Obba rivulosa]|uniref:Carboxylic ester hydrolase n=1 Tax=Obba rivulosa TaxID=1052685 RepID=A0A8E2ALH1_9APHY|nr:carboxylesterase from carbohydrate esterase [Obba rivulosa]